MILNLKSLCSFDEEVMHIAGSLIPANTGCVKWLEKKNGGEALHMDRLVSFYIHFLLMQLSRLYVYVLRDLLFVFCFLQGS